MDPISVPAAPRSSYNPNRRVSDLIFDQLKHFQHVELKRHDISIDPALARDIYTEAGAARYIAALTNAVRGVTGSGKAAQLAVVPAFKPVKKVASSTLAIAAAAAPAKKSASTKAVSKSIKKAAPKKVAKKTAPKKSSGRKP